MKTVTSRIVLHFPGFEPLNAEQHRLRFERAADQTSDIWNVKIACSKLQIAGEGNAFSVKASGQQWSTQTKYHVLDLAEHIAGLQSRPILSVVASGYAACAKVVAYGGAWNYFRHAWRFGLFFVFPFLFMALGLTLAALIAFFPLWTQLSLMNCIWTIPVALGFFAYGFLPIANRFHTMLLFSDWKCAVDFATLKDKDLNARLAQMVSTARSALKDAADEYLIISHSIGGMAAAHVIGQLLEEEPQLFEGKKIVFASLGSGILQGALLRSAKRLRARVCAIANSADIFWFDVQCMTDVSNFYKTNVAALCGYKGERQPKVSFIRIKTMLSKERYLRIKRDLLRVHRQYVLGNDVRANYDYGLMCAGPMPSATFASLGIGEFAQIAPDSSNKSA
jgi:hypothetical protein